MNLYIRYPEAEISKRFWYARFYAPDAARPGHTKPVLWNTHQLIKQRATEEARRERDARFAGKASTITRAASEPTIADIVERYTRHAECAPYVAKANQNCLLNLIRRALGPTPDPKARPVSVLNAETLRQWRTSILDDAPDDDDRAEASALRSANSVLRQARSLFTPQLREHYAAAGLELPAGLLDFLTRPGLNAPSKTDYQKPDDHTITRTFASLATLRESDPNLYMAVYLALGFGLRKDEIATCRVDWFCAINNRIHCRLKRRTKNGSMDATIECQNGAWAQLGPLLVGRNTTEFALTGTESERTDEVFRRCSAWMRDLGWKTQKTMHEWRAYAGCSVAETCELLYTSQWMRHGSIEVTQRSYGRYLRQKSAPDAPLSLPTVQPVGEFRPTVAAG